MGLGFQKPDHKHFSSLLEQILTSLKYHTDLEMISFKSEMIVPEMSPPKGFVKQQSPQGLVFTSKRNDEVIWIYPGTTTDFPDKNNIDKVLDSVLDSLLNPMGVVLKDTSRKIHEAKGIGKHQRYLRIREASINGISYLAAIAV